MSEPARYRLRDLKKSHGANFTLEIRRLSIMPGEVLGLLGPTGAGKSTLLSLLTGLARPTAGEILFDGVSFERAPPLPIRRRIVMVHQRPALLRGDVRRNVEYGLRLRGRAEIGARVDAALAQFGLASLASQSVRTLSGGQAQLVAVARAVVVEPDVLLLDEPTSHLDPAHVELIEAAVRKYQETRGATVVWATHNLFQARRVASRAALLLQGQLVEEAPTETFFNKPADPRTADFTQGRMVY